MTAPKIKKNRPAQQLHQIISTVKI